MRRREPNETVPILLLLDGHGSHETDEFVDEALLHNIHVLMLPPHTTHKTQPLDVGCFGPLKAMWTQRCEEHLELFNTPIPRANFVKEYLTVRDGAMTSDLICAAFCKSGIVPFNRTIFDDTDFGPSHASSTEAHLPESFPGQEDDDVSMSEMMEVDETDSEDEEDTEDEDIVMEAGMDVWALSGDHLAGIDDFGTWPSLSDD
jgi:hypothetical protein